MLKKDKKVKENKVEELAAQLKRALADYDNLKKRTEEEKQAVVKFANTILIVKFLEILDNLETAQKNLGDQGLGLIVKKFKDVLASENIKEIDTRGKKFDPNLHEAVATADGEAEDQIAEVLQKGYSLDDKVLRPARVKVTRVAQRADHD